MLKKSLVFLLVICMALCASFAVFAGAESTTSTVATEAELKAAVEGAGEGDTIVLSADIAVTEMIAIPAGKTLTIDLNGKAITAGYQSGSTDRHLYPFDVYGNLTIKDSEGTGSVTGRGIYVQVGSKLTIDGGAIYGIDSNGGSALYQYGGDIIINGGRVEQKAEGTYNFAINAAAGTVTVKGGWVGGNHGAIAAVGAAVVIEDGEFVCTGTEGMTDNVLYSYGESTIIINGGTFTADNDGPAGGTCVYDANGGAKIKGGTFGNSSGGDVWGTTGTEINGGTFEDLQETQHVTVGATIVNGGKTYTKTESGLVEVKPVKIGETEYDSLQAAIDAAKSLTGDVTVEIYDKVTLNQSLSGSFDSITFVGKTIGAEIYLDVQGYITATGKTVAFENLILSKSEGSFITNAGFMNVAFGVYDVAKVTYTNCTFTNGAYASSGEVIFDGCTFKRSHDKYGLWAYGDVNATVENSIFADYRGIKMYAEGAAKTVNLTVKNTNFSALTGKPAIVLTYGESVTLEGNTYSDTGVFELDLDGAPNGVPVTSDVAPTCKNDNGACGVLVDGKIYTTVAQAAEVATAGSTVTLLHDSTETVELDAGVLLDKNGFEAAGVTVALLGGAGTAEDPYTISSLEALKWFRNDVNAGNSYAGKFVKLTADIDLASVADWTPIGNSTYAFQGTFDGDNYKIFNLTILGTNSNAGFFGFTTNGEIKNLTIENAKVSGRLNVGVVAGTPYTSKYTNIQVLGHVEVEGMAYVGGVGGKNAYANWTNITVDVDSASYVMATSTENGVPYRTYVGGVIGFIGEGGHTFKNISSNIKVIGDVCDIGGIAGIAHYGNNFEDVTFNGAVEAPEGAEEVGGIAGVWHNAAGTSVTFTNVSLGTDATVTVGGEDVTASNGVVGGAYNASNNTAGNSGSLNVDGVKLWPKVGTLTNAYTSDKGKIWGECGGNATESFVFKIYSGDTYMGSTSLNNVDGIIDGDVYVTWSIFLDAASNTDPYWTMEWTIAPSLTCQPTRVEQWVDGVKVAEAPVELNGSDGIFAIYAAVADADGTITGYYTSLQAAIDAVADNGIVALLRDTTVSGQLINQWYEGIYYEGDKSFTIDLGGHKLSNNSTVTDYLILIKNVGSKANEITFKNGTIEATSTAYCAICTSSGSTQQITVNLENIDVIGQKSNGSVIKVRGGSVLNVKADTVITGKDSYLAIECVAATVNIYEDAAIYMNGTTSYNGCLVGVCNDGTVNVYGGYGKGVKGGFIAMTSGGTINVYGGEWIANTDGSIGDNSNLYVLTAQNNSYEGGYVGASIINVYGGVLRGGVDAWILNQGRGEVAELNIFGGNFNANPQHFVENEYVAVQKSDSTYDVVKAAAKVGTTYYATIQAAINAAQDGDVVTILPGEYAAINISYKNITIQGTVGANGELLTTIKGGNPAITGHGFNGTIKDLKIVDAWKVMYAEPAGNVTADNLYVTGAMYGLHLVAYAEGLTWTIQNSYMDLSWANSFGVYGNGDAAIVIKGNTFETTDPYYSDYGSIHVNSFLPNVTVTENVFGENAKIYIDGSVTDTSKLNISGNYHADGVDNAFADDADGVTVTINEYYTDRELTNLVKRVAKIGDVNYETLDAALKAAVSGDTIIVLVDSILTEAIELNGMTLTICGDAKIDLGNLITVSGECTLNITAVMADLDGNDSCELKLAHGTVLTDSNVVGDATLYGKVIFKGDNTFAMLYDYGNAYSTDYAEWIVEEGASLTLTTKARYGLGYGDKVTIYGSLEDALTARETLTDGDVAFFTHGLVAMSNWDVPNSFTAKNAYVIIGSNNSFGNSHKHTGSYEFNFDNVVLDASRITFYEANSKTIFTINKSDVKIGTFMTRDTDSVFTLTDSVLLSTTTFNGNDEGNYHKGTLILVGSEITYSAPLVMEGGTITLDINSLLTAPSITGAGVINIDATDFAGDDILVIKADMSGFTGTINVLGKAGAQYEITEEGVVVKLVLALEGEGTEEAPYKISTLDELINLRDMVAAGNDYDGMYFKLTADIDLSTATVARLSARSLTANWTPIGTKEAPFKGTFDGDGKVISNLIIIGGENQGFFGYADNAVIKNVILENVTVIGTDCVGGIAGQVFSTSLIYNCHVRGRIQIEGQTNVGGIVGKYYTKVTNCSVIGDGAATSYIKGVYVASDFEGDNIGGIMGHCGENNALTGNVVKNITISGTRKVGGIVGIADQNTDITDCVVDNVIIETTATEEYANSKVTSMSIGGLIGQYQAAGSSVDGTVTGCSISNVTFNNANNVTVAIGTVVGGARGGSTGMLAPSDKIVVEENTVDFATITGSNNDYLLTIVAMIGNMKYETLADALKAAQDGETIVLLADATPALTSQRAITKAAVIDLNGYTLTLTEDDLYFGTTTFKNGTIVVDSSVKPSTAVFWMFANQTLTFDAVKLVATGVTGTYLIGLDGNNSDLNLLNGSEIFVDNATALDLDIICVNGSTGNDIVIADSKVTVTNLDGRVFFRGNYTVKGASEIVLGGITKAGFRIEAGQTLSIEDTSSVTITGEPRDGGIHLTAVTASYVKADSATVNATVNKPVAMINGTVYSTLEEAFKAATDGCVIEILADVVIDYAWDCRDYATNGSHSQFKESVTINGNGHTIKFTGTVNDSNWNTIFRFEENATVNNLTIDISEATGAQRVITAKKSLTVDGLTIIGSAKYGIIFGEGASVDDLAVAEIVITNSTLTGTRRAISDNEGGKDVKSVTITGNTLNANVYVSAFETITFNNNTATGEVDLRSYAAENVLAVEAQGNTLNASAQNYTNAKTANVQDEFVLSARGEIAYRGYIEVSADREAIKVDLQNVYASNSVVVKLYDADGNLLITTTLKAGGYEGAWLTTNIVLSGTASGSWDTVINAEKLTVANVPTLVELWIDGDVMDTFEPALGNATDAAAYQLPAYLALDSVYKEAKIDDTYYATIADALKAAQADDIVTIFAGEYTQSLNVNKAITVVGETDAEGNNLVKFIGSISITADGATVKNITASDPATTGYNCTLKISAKNVLVEGCVITDANAMRYSYTSGTVTFRDCVLTAEGTWVIHFDGNAGGEVIVENCEVNGWIGIGGGIKVTFRDSKFDNGNWAGGNLYGTDITIDGCEFNNGFKFGIVSDGANVTVTDSTMTGGNIEDLFRGDDIVSSNITIDGVKLVRVAKIGNTYYETLADAIAAAQDGETITLVATASGDVTVAAGQNIVIDLNGNDIVGTINAIINNGTLVINDSVGTGNVYTTDVSAQGRAAIVNNGTLTINGGWFGDSNNDTTDRNAINRGNAVKNYGTVTINGGYFTNVSNQYIDSNAYAYAINTLAGGTTTINNATVYGDINGLIYSDGKTIVNDGSFTLGRPNEENNLWFLAYGDVEIKGGTWSRAFRVPSWNTGDPTFHGDVAVSGGAFDVDVEEKYCAEGFIPADLGDGTYGVKAGSYVARNTTTGVGYESLADAIAAAQSGDTITLLADIELAESVEISGKTITLDLGECTIYDKNTTVLNSSKDVWGLIKLNNANLTVTGNGTIKCNYTNVSGGWTGMAYAIDVDSTSTLTVNGGTFINGNGGIQTQGEVTVNGGTFISHNGGTCIMALYSKAKVTVNGGDFKDSVGASDVYTGSGAVWSGFGATVVINGGTYNFAADPEHGNVVWTLFPAQHAIAGLSGFETNMTVTGGTFYNFNPATDVIIDYSASAGFTFGSVVAEGYMVEEKADGTYGVVVDPAYGMIAKIGDTYYATLAEAITAAQADDVIVLLADCAESVTITQKFGISFTLDGGNYTYTGKITVKGRNNGSAAETLTIQNFNFKTDVESYIFIDATGSQVQNLTVQNCNFASTALDENGVVFHNGVVAIKANKCGNLTVKNCVADPVYYLVNNTAGGRNLTIDGCTVNGFYGVRVNNCIDAVIKNSTFNTAVYAIALDAGNSAVTTIENCTITVSTADRYAIFFNKPAYQRTLVINGTNVFANSADASAAWINTVSGADFKVVMNDAGLAQPAGMVAKIGNTYYNSLAFAIAEAEDNATITLVNDIDIANVSVGTLSGEYNTLFRVAGKTITIDMNGKTIGGAYTGEEMLVGVFSTEENGHLTLTGNGTVDITATTTVYALLVNYDGTSTLTVENGTYKLDKASSALIYSDANEAVTIYGGYFHLGNVGTGSNGSPWIFNVKGQNENHVIVLGGTFNADVNHQYYEFEVSIPKEKACKNNGNGTWTVVDAVAYVDEKSTSSSGYTKQVGFATLADAIEAAQAGETITLLVDLTLDGVITIDKAIILDLGGKTVTGADDAIVFDVKAETTIMNGTILGNKSGTTSGLIDIYANLTLDGVTVETSKINALRFKDGGLTATLTNCNVTGAFKGYGGSVWNIVSGTYKASNTAINDQLNGTASISGGTFHYAIDATECAPGYAVVDNGDGTYGVKYAPVAFVDANNNGVLDDGEVVYGSLEAIFDTYKTGDVYIVLIGDAVVATQVDTDADAKYYLNTNVAEGVTVEFAFADDWNYVQKMYVGENVTIKAPYLLAWTELEVYGTIITDYLYITTADVLIAEGAVVTANTGDATVQVKNGATLTVNGELNTAILNVWAGESKLVVNGANAKVNASWIDIWDGTPAVSVENGAMLDVDSIKASRGGSIAVDNATLDADKVELGHNGESTGKLTVTNGTVTGEVKLTVVGSELAGPEGMNVTTDIADHKVVYENGVYKVVAKIYVAEVGGVKYESLAEALAAAQDGDVITLIWNEGDAPIAMNGSVFGKTVTITGTATVDWSKGFLFIGRGGAGNGTVIFENANLTSASNNAATGIHVSGREKDTDNKFDGTLIINNSVIELDYLINKGTMTLDNSTLTVKNGFSIGGRPAIETESGEDATAIITLNNGSKLVVNNHNGMGLGYEAIGVMNVNSGSTFECTQSFLVTAKGTMNVNGGTVKVAGTLTNNGAISVSGASAISAKVTGAGWVYMHGVTLDANTNLVGAKVRFASGTNNIDGSTIIDGFFQVGIGAYNGVDANVDTENGVVVNVKNAHISANGETYAGWIGTGFYDTDAEKAAAMTDAKYVLNIENSIAEFGYLHISNDGELNVKGNAAEKKWYNNSDYSFYAGDFIINGVASFEATDVLALYTKVSCDNGTDVPGTLNVLAGTEYEAERHNGAISGTNFVLYKTAVVNVAEGGKLHIGECTSIAADASMNIAGEVTALGTITNNGKIALTSLNAQLTTPETTGVSVEIDGYKAVYENGVYKVVAIVYVAEVNGVKYEFLADAAAAAQAGDTILLIGDVTLDEALELPAGIILNGNGKTINGTIKAGGDLTFVGATTVDTFNPGWYNNTITIGEGASLTTGRMTVSYGNIFNIVGSITDAKTADKSTIVPSLELVAGISFNGDGAGVQFNVTNAYVILGDSSTKHGGATGEFNMNFKNSIVDFTKTLKTYQPTVDGLNPVVNVTAEDSVISFASHLELWRSETYLTLENSNLTVGGSFANAGTIKVLDGSNFVVKAPIMSSHGGNTGTIVIDGGVFELVDSNQDWENAGTIKVTLDGKLITNDFKCVGEGKIVVDCAGSTQGAAVIVVDGNGAYSFEGVVTLENGKGAAVSYENGDVTITKGAILIGDKSYATLDEALAAAQVGDTIVLVDNVVYDDIVMLKGVSLDLNGYTLDAEGLVALKNANVLDNGATKGLLKIADKDLFTLSGGAYPMLPVWNEEGTGYVFVNVNPLSQLQVKAEDKDKFTVIYRPSINGGGVTNEAMFADGALDNDLTFKINILCMKNGAIAETIGFALSEDLIKEVYGNNKAFYLNIFGATNRFDEYKIEFVIESTSGISFTTIMTDSFVPTTVSE